jgi:hypothetical protein
VNDHGDIIETLRGIQCSNAACSNLRIAMGMKLAIYEIERLRAERDAARRQCCTQAVSQPLGNGTVYNCEDAVKEATRRGWDCFGQEESK